MAAAGPAAPGVIRKVTSLANPAVKDIRGLALSKNRKTTGRFIAEGVKLVADGIDAGWTVDTLVYAQSENSAPVERIAARCYAAGATVLEVTHPILAKITHRDNPQTVVGVFRQRLLKPAEIARTANEGVWVALEQVRDPGNFGTIVRTADAVGASGVLLIGDTVDPFSMEAVRATMGSIFHVALARFTIAEFVAFAASFPGKVIGTHLRSELDYRRAEYSRPLLLVMGPEQGGLSPPIAQLCTELVKIPMAGRADSLNLAVATGVMLYEIFREALRIDG